MIIDYLTLEYFFSDPQDVPDDALWSAYGWQHFLWLFIMGAIIFLACKVFRKADKETQSKVLKYIAIWILIQEIIKDILFLWTGLFTLENLPFHFCGISIFFSLWYAFRPNELNGAYIYGMSMPGALCALLFPNWTQYPMLHFSNINSFTIHGELILFAMLALVSGRLVPNIKKVPQLFGIIVAMAIPIYFLNRSWGTNFMFISTPSPGSPLMPLYGIFGNGYAIAAGVLLFFAWIIMFIPWRKRANKQKQH